MIIATSTTPSPAAGPNDALVAAGRSLKGFDDAGAADPTTGAAAVAVDGFGTLLARRLDPRGTNDLPSLRPDDDPSVVPLGLDGKPLLATTTGAAPAPPDSAGAASGSVRDSDAVPDPAAAAGVPQAGSDLAAQLALVSQWAAVTKPADAPVPRDEALGTPRTLDAVRAPAPAAVDATRDRGVAVDPGVPEPILVPVPAAPLAITATSPVERDARLAATAGVSTRTLDPGRGERRSASAEPAASSSGGALDPLLAKVLADRAGGTAGDAGSGAGSGADHGAGSATGNEATRATSAAAGDADRPSGVVGSFIASLTAPVTGERHVAAVAAPAVVLHETVGTPAWSHEVGQATLRMAVNDLQGASLQLNPAHLGPVDVQMRIDNGVAHVAFVAAHADTRHALESSRATLDQLFNDQGIKLGDCSVGDSQSSGRSATADANGGSSRQGGQRAADAGTDRDLVLPTPTVAVRALGLVDTFA